MDKNLIHIGVNLFVIKEGKILLGKRLKPGKGYGQWGLPGGHLEFNEHFSECAKRELLEETGLLGTDLEFLQLVNSPRGSEHYAHVNFLVKSWTGEVQNREPDKCAGWEWFSLTNLPEIFYGHQSSVQAFKDGVGFID